MGAFDDLVPSQGGGVFSDLIPADDAIVAGGYGPQRAETLAGNFRLGALKGMMNLPDAGAQLVTRLIESVSPAGSSLEAWARKQRETVEGVNRERQQFYEANKGEGSQTGEIMGNLAVTAPMSMMLPTGGATFAGRLAAGTGQGAGFGALQPVQEGADFWSEKARQTGFGAAAGAAGATLGEGIARVLAPKASIDPNIQRLMKAGVRPTPGQVMGGGAKRVEEKLASVPGLGGAIKAGQERGIDQFNRAAINEALEPIGQKLPSNVMKGRDSIEWAGEKISEGYNALVPQLSAKVDARFATDIKNLVSLSKNMVPQRAEQFDRILSDKAMRHMSKNGTFTGESLKQIESELGRMATQFRSTADADQRLLGDALREAQSIFRQLVERANPTQAPQLKALNEAYSKFLRVETAAGRVGAKEGVFSPAQLTSAVRQMDPSLRHRAFARGNAPMQNLAAAGEAVLSNRIPNSGTADRIMQAAMIGGPIAAAEHFADPRLAALMLPALAYTRGGQSLAAHLLATRPAGAQPAAEAIRALHPILGRGLALGGLDVFAGVPAAGN